MNHCDACRFDYEAVPFTAVAAQLRTLPDRFHAALHAADEEGLARQRPDQSTWSALEYTCHVRDVLRVQRERLELALAEDRPAFAPMRREERAVEDRYNEQEIDMVLAELGGATEAFAVALERLDTEQWQRTGIYNWPEPAERSMAWLARHTLHEGLHHLDDVLRVFQAVRPRAT